MTNISIESAATTVRRFECGDYQLLVIRAGEAEITLHCTAEGAVQFAADVQAAVAGVVKPFQAGDVF